MLEQLTDEREILAQLTMNGLVARGLVVAAWRQDGQVGYWPVQQFMGSPRDIVPLEVLDGLVPRRRVPGAGFAPATFPL